MAASNSDGPPGGVATAFHREEIAGFRRALIGRIAAMGCVAVLITVLVPWPGPLYYYALLALFVLIGYAEYAVARAAWGHAWHQYLLTTIDFALLAFTLIYPSPMVAQDLPVPVTLNFGSFIYFFTLLAGLAYVYKPTLVLWGGVAGALSWSVGILWMMSLPGSVWTQTANPTTQEILDRFADPYFIDLDVRLQEVAILLICAGLLALAVGRARRIALHEAALAQQRANLARYFPRRIADMLAGSPRPFAEPRQHAAAVLFADLVGFTHWCEQRSPREVIAYLRAVHDDLAHIVFRHGGTLDKFIGDGVLATFGTPEPSETAAGDAIAAALAMVDRFNADRPNRHGAALPLSVGVHYGPIVLGDIGSRERMEFATIGSTVNVASRLEHATRDHGCAALLSGALVDAAAAEAARDQASWHGRLVPRGPIAIRGLSEPIAAYAITGPQETSRTG